MLQLFLLDLPLLLEILGQVHVPFAQLIEVLFGLGVWLVQQSVQSRVAGRSVLLQCPRGARNTPALAIAEGVAAPARAGHRRELYDGHVLADLLFFEVFLCHSNLTLLIQIYAIINTLLFISIFSKHIVSISHSIIILGYRFLPLSRRNLEANCQQYLTLLRKMCMRARDNSPDDDETEFWDVYKDIESYYAKDLKSNNDSKIQSLCKKIKRYCELAVRAERRDNDLFDNFCENKSLDLLYNLFLRAQRTPIMVCVIQTMSMMLVSLSQQNSVNYFLSSSALMNLLQIRFPQINTQVAEYYINLLKSISAKLDDTTVHLFYNEKIPIFPLLWQAVRFHNHPEPLIRNTSRNIVLSISKLSQPRVKEYLSSFPFIIYYSHLASDLKSIWSAIDKIVSNKELNKQEEASELSSLKDDHLDLLMYIEDLSTVCSEKARKHLLTCYLGQCIVPLIRDLSQPKFKLNRRTIFFILSIIISNSKITEVVELIAITLFGKYIQKDLSLAMLSFEAKDSLSSYNRPWAFDHFWDNHYEVVSRNCRNLFNIQGRPRSQSDECDSPRRSLHPSSSIAQLNISLFGIERIPSALEREISKIENLFDVRISNSSRSSLSSPRYRSSLNLLGLLSGIHKDLRESSFIDLDELDDNKNTNTLLSCLDSEDQSVVYFSVQMIKELLRNKSASECILKFCGLFDSGRPSDFYSNENLRKIIQKLLEVFSKKSGRFQISTYVAIQKLIRKIVKDNQSKMFDSFAKNIIGQSLKTLVQRFSTYVTNIKDHVAVLSLYNSANAKLSKVMNKEELQNRFLTADQQNFGVSSLFDQIQSDFAAYLLLTKLKAAYIPGKHSYQELTKASFNEHNLSDILGKEIEFPEDQIVTGQFKEKSINQNFKCFILINKAGFMLSERMSPNKGRIYVNCELADLTCEQRATDIKRLYFTYSDRKEKERTFYVNFSELKTATSTKMQFEVCKQLSAKQVVDHLVNNFNLCLEDMDYEKNSQFLLEKEYTSEKETSPGLSERAKEKQISMNESLIDLWPF